MPKRLKPARSTKKLSIDDLSRRLRTPIEVQKFIRNLDYNKEQTQRSASAALRAGSAHCLEGAFIAAAILEKHGYPPLVLSMESKDGLDHVIFIFRSRGKWGAIAQSRDEGLHGRKPVYRSIRDLAWSYYDPYVDGIGEITAYQIANLDEIGADWRNSKQNLWKVENYLLDLPHRKLRASRTRHKRILKAYKRRGLMPVSPDWI